MVQIGDTFKCVCNYGAHVKTAKPKIHLEVMTATERRKALSSCISAQSSATFPLWVHGGDICLSKFCDVDLGKYLDGWTAKELRLGTENASPFVGAASKL